MTAQHRRPRATARAFWVVAIALQPSCYTYAPGTVETVPEGARVRALITPAAEQRLQPFGVNGTTLQGELQQREDDQLRLLVPTVLMGSGPRNRPLYQQVVVSSGDVLRLDVRRLDAFRTGVAVGVATAAVAVAAVQVLGGWTGSSSGGDGGGPPESLRGWVISIPIFWR